MQLNSVMHRDTLQLQYPESRLTVNFSIGWWVFLYCHVCWCLCRCKIQLFSFRERERSVGRKGGREWTGRGVGRKMGENREEERESGEEEKGWRGRGGEEDLPMRTVLPIFLSSRSVCYLLFHLSCYCFCLRSQCCSIEIYTAASSLFSPPLVMDPISRCYCLPVGWRGH